MTKNDKYEEIRRMSREDRREIHEFAVQRSRELLAGIEKRSTSTTKSLDAPSVLKSKSGV